MTVFGTELSWIHFSQFAIMFTDYIIAFLFFKNFLGQENGNKIKNIFCAFAFVVVVVLTNQLFMESTAIMMPLSLLIYTLITFLLFNGKWYWKLLAVSLFFVIVHLLDLFAIFSLMRIANINTQAIFDNGALFFSATIISRVLLLLTTKILGHFRNKENKHISFEYWIAIITFPVISSFVIYLIFEFNWRLQSAEVTATTVIALFGILYINIFAFRLINFFANKTERDTKAAIIQQNFEKQVEECKRLNYLITSRGKFFHDIKHFKSTLDELVEKKNIDKALQLLEEVMELEALQTKEYVHTGDDVINALFNYHIAQAEKNGIKVDVGDVYCPKGLRFDIADLCSIFGNSLENAVEACMRMKSGEKFITIGLRYCQDSLVYRVTNSTDGKVVKGKRWYDSTKTTMGLSGLGIEIMENAVEKYGGTFGAELKFDEENNKHFFEVGFSISNK